MAMSGVALLCLEVPLRWLALLVAAVAEGEEVAEADGDEAEPVAEADGPETNLGADDTSNVTPEASAQAESDAKIQFGDFRTVPADCWEKMYGRIKSE